MEVALLETIWGRIKSLARKIRCLGKSGATMHRIATVVDSGHSLAFDLSTDDLEIVKKLIENKSKVDLRISEASINEITSVVDRGLSMTINLPAEDFELVKELLKKKSKGDPLVYVVFVDNKILNLVKN